jgi:trehalose 6-phosphate phosphatase
MQVMNLLKGQHMPFWAKFVTAKSVVLISDYDGTLAPFDKIRQLAMPYSGVNIIIKDVLTKTNIRFVIISGRPATEVAEYFEIPNIPEIWGTHGWERLLPNGMFNSWPVDDDSRRGLENAKKLADSYSLSKYCEAKTAAVAFHWRGISLKEKRRIICFANSKLKEIANEHNLILTDFNGGVELRVKSRNKGDAVKDLIRESPKNAFFAYLGDDLTDEDAFEAISNVGGIGILVSKTKRQTKAMLQLIPPEGLLDFLRMCVMLREV